MTTDSNNIPQMRQRIVTLQDIAQQAGVSIATVSYALNGKEHLVSVSTMERINAIAKELGYDPARTHGARRLVMRRSGTRILNHLVATVFTWSQSTYHTNLFTALMDVFSEGGFGLVTLYAHNKDHSSHSILARGEIDGLIIYGSDRDWSTSLTELAQRCQSQHIPIVSLIHQEPGISSVVSDDCGGGYAATKHMLELGHRRLLHFHHKDSGGIAEQRYSGYRQACLDFGCDPEKVLTFCNSYDPGGERSVSARLDLGRTSAVT